MMQREPPTDIVDAMDTTGAMDTAIAADDADAMAAMHFTDVADATDAVAGGTILAMAGQFTRCLSSVRRFMAFGLCHRAWPCAIRTWHVAAERSPRAELEHDSKSNVV